jgi:hypothetical protein
VILHRAVAPAAGSLEGMLEGTPCYSLARYLVAVIQLQVHAHSSVGNGANRVLWQWSWELVMCLVVTMFEFRSAVITRALGLRINSIRLFVGALRDERRVDCSSH